MIINISIAHPPLQDKCQIFLGDFMSDCPESGPLCTERASPLLCYALTAGVEGKSCLAEAHHGQSCGEEKKEDVEHLQEDCVSVFCLGCVK